MTGLSAKEQWWTALQKNAIDKILAGRKDCQPVELQIAVLFEAGDLFQIALT